jgi:hypothetical protein
MSVGIGTIGDAINERSGVDGRPKKTSDKVEHVIGKDFRQDSDLAEEDSRSDSNDLSEQGQSSFESKSEGQLVEDVKAVEPMLTSVSYIPLGSAALASPIDDDPLFCQKSVDQLRRERSLRPSHVVDGGGDASQVYQNECFEFKRPYCGPSHVVDGGGDEFKQTNHAPNQWLIQSKFSELELTTQLRKKELKKEMAEIERYMLQDSRFHSFVWSLKYKKPGAEPVGYAQE